jgi:AcrR family transcriptional regulator
VLDAALASFGTKGYEATSLDQVAAELGVRKQTILYYYSTKPQLLDAVVDRSADELAGVLRGAVVGAGPGFERVQAIVRSVFRLALRRPEPLGLLREVSRLGPPSVTRLTDQLEPLVDEATAFLEAEMASGRMRACDARLLLLSVYSTVLGVATEVDRAPRPGHSTTAMSPERGKTAGRKSQSHPPAAGWPCRSRTGDGRSVPAANPSARRESPMPGHPPAVRPRRR